MTPLTILKHYKRNFEKEAEIEVIFFDLSTSGFNAKKMRLKEEASVAAIQVSQPLTVLM